MTNEPPKEMPETIWTDINGNATRSKFKGGTHYTHTARLLELVRGMYKEYERNMELYKEGKIDGYNAALQDVERILGGGE